MDLAWMASAGAAVGLGMVFGGAIVWRLCARRAARRAQELMAAAREQHVSGTHGLRAANARLQAALDQEKLAIHSRISAAAAEHRAAMSRAEGQLQFAYAEIDRLQASARRGEPAGSCDAHGFALTQPFSR